MSEETKNKKYQEIPAYVVTPDDFSQWTIYYFASKWDNSKVTGRCTGYGLEKLYEHIKDNSVPVLITGNANIRFILDYNNADVNLPGEFDINLSNQQYIEKYIENGAIPIKLYPEN